jgi:hypothetical protein
MSDIDDAIRRDLGKRLDRLAIPTAGRAAAVRSDLRRSRRRRVLAVVSGAALVVCAVAAAFVVRGRPGDQVVYEPTNSLRVVRTLSASSLGLAKPEAGTIGPNGNLYITDSAHQTVTEATPAGRVVRTWGGQGTRPGRFRLANGGIAVDQKGRVYVADSGNARIQVFTSTGHLIRQMGVFGNGPGHFQFPWAIAVGADGSVYVSDDRQATLTKLSPHGHQDWRLGGPGTPPDLVGHTHFGGFDSRARLVAADDDSGRVVYVSPRGKEVDAFGTGASGDHQNTVGHPPATDFPEGACDTTVDAQDYVYVGGCSPVEENENLIQVYDPAHRLVGVWPHSPLRTAPRFGPDGLAVSVGIDGSIVELTVYR